MRPYLLIATAALGLAACNKDRQEEAGRNAGSGLTAEDIVANDVTAIDAVTADASNMAADIDYADALADLSNNGSDSDAGTGGNSARPRRSTSPTRTPGAPRESADEPATNSQ